MRVLVVLLAVAASACGPGGVPRGGACDEQVVDQPPGLFCGAELFCCAPPTELGVCVAVDDVCLCDSDPTPACVGETRARLDE